VVRRPAPVLTRRRRRRPGAGTLALATPLVALTYFLAAPALPLLPGGDTAVLAAGAIALLVLAATVLSLLPARDALIGPLLILLGGGLLMAALDVAGVGAGANVAEALVASSAGLLLARWLRAPAIAVAVPLFVALIDAWSVASGPSARMLAGGTAIDDPLSFDLPGWGGAISTGHLGLSDAFFLSMFAAWALHYGFRGRATIAGLVLGLIASLVLGVALDRAIPALPLLAVGYLLPSLDRVGTLLRHA
jgi:hypothetical protein